MAPLRLTLSALGAPVTRRLHGMRGRLRVQRAWAAGAVRPPEEASLPEPFLWGDSDVGRRLLAGQWQAFGLRVDLGERTIWDVDLRDGRLEAARDTFAWLDELAALGTRSARERAQAWTLGWIRRFGKGRGTGWQPERAGRRMLHWSAHARLLTEGLPEADAERFWRAVASHGRVLLRAWRDAPPGLGQTEALGGAILALTLLGDPEVEAAALDLAHLAELVIDGGGGTPSRAPGELAEITIFLIWVARILENAGYHPRPGHLHAIARAVPAIRALRLGDGSMARFHGGGGGRPDRLDQALAELRLSARAKPRLAMGYARLAGGRMVAIMDAAAPPMGPGALRAAAATLSFEMSSGRTPVVVNAGPGQPFGASEALFARGTGAHSTVEISGTSSSRMCRPGLAAQAYGGWLEQGPSVVSVRQAQDHTGQWLLATHDGYVETLGLLHERRLFVDAKGRECRGEEIIYVTDARAQKRFDAAVRRHREPMMFVARFHLHPDVAAAVDPVRQVVELRPPGADTWLFRAAGGRVDLRESQYFDPEYAEPRSCFQIMVSAEIIEYLGQVNWSFTRVAAPSEPPRAAAAPVPT